MLTARIEKIEKVEGAPQMKFSQKYNHQNRCVDFNAYLGEDTVYSSAKLLDLKHTVTVWFTNPDIRRTNSILVLDEFYQQVMGGKEVTPNVYLTNFPICIIRPSTIHSKYVIPAKIGTILDRLNQIPDNQNKTLIFSSDQIECGIELPSQEDYKRLGLAVPSRLERVMFTISSHQISLYLAKLISSTSRYPVKDSDLVEHLRKSHKF